MIVSTLCEDAKRWVGAHPCPAFPRRTLDWLESLEPAASEPQRLAALTLDMDRAFPAADSGWVEARDWALDGYRRWRTDRAAIILAAWLDGRQADQDLCRRSVELVRAQDHGDAEEAAQLRSARALAFLETMPGLLRAWAENDDGESARRRVDACLAEIGPVVPEVERQARGFRDICREQISACEAKPGKDGGASTPESSAATASPVPAAVLRGLDLVRDGIVFRLAKARFPGMPLFPGHPPFQVLTYRSPSGIRAAGDEPWGPLNDIGLGYMSELVMGSQHTGAHIDAHAHMTIGPDDHWHGGSARTELGDFGPLSGDATEIPPIWRRGVLYDVAGSRGVSALPAGEPIDAAELERIESRTGVAAGRGDVALVRTGYLSGWPDEEMMTSHVGAGPDITASRLLADRGVIAVGSDTETFEVQPTNHPGEPTNPQPVHTYLLIERGVYIMESLDLEALAEAGVTEFLFVALPLGIAGATGSMIDPVAVI